MRSLAAAAVLASGFRVAAASGLPVADETALLQTRADPAAESSFAMPKLHCDMDTGCHYEGLPERAPKPATPMFPSFLPPVDPATLKKLVEGIKLPDPAKIQEELAKLKLPDFGKIMQDAAKLMPPSAPKQQQQAPPAFQMPDLAKIMQGLANAPKPQQAPPAFQMPDLAKIMEGASKLVPPAAAPKPQQAPPAFQMPDFAKIMQDAAKLMPHAAPAQQPAAPPPAFQMPDFAKIAEGLAKLKPPAPGVSALQVSSAADAESATAYFVPDNGMVCVQGSEEYVAKSLSKLKASPLGAGYQNSLVQKGTCADVQYADGPMPDKCLPEASLFMSKAHQLQPLSEPILIAKYALKHGMEAVKEGMAGLCK